MIIAIDPRQGHGHELPSLGHRLNDPVLALVEQRQALRPAGGHIGEHQGIEEGALGVSAAVGHQIDLKEAGLGVIPVGEGTHRDLMLQERAGFGGADTAQGRVTTDRAEEAVSGGRADGEEARTYGMCQALLDRSLGEIRCVADLQRQHLGVSLAGGVPGVKGPLRGWNP